MAPASSSTIKLVAVAALSLIMGYFAGREHVKYELRNAFANAAEEMQKGFASVFNGGDSPTAAAAPLSATPARTEPAPAPATLPQPIDVTLIAKDFRPSNFRANVYEDSITFALEFDNRSGKDVRAFEGTLAFYDLLDNRILASKLTITDPLSAHAKTTWKGEIDYNQFNDAHARLRGEALASLKTEFVISKILFADGTTQEF